MIPFQLARLDSPFNRFFVSATSWATVVVLVVAAAAVAAVASVAAAAAVNNLIDLRRSLHAVWHFLSPDSIELPIGCHSG